MATKKKSPAPKSSPPKPKKKSLSLEQRALKAAARLAKKEAKAAKLAKSQTPEAIKAAAKSRDARIRTLYNICSEEYEAVLAYQNGVCAITGKLPGANSLSIDHCHLTGRVRGLLSPWANKGLAVFQDNPDWLRRAADYIDNPPVSIALGQDVYGVIGRMTRKAKSRRYGPDGSKAPQPRTHKLSTSKNIEPKEGN